LNNTTTSSVTYLYIDNLDKDGTTITAWLDALDDSTNTTNRGRVHIREINTPTNFVEFIVTGVVVDGTGYRKVPVTYVSASNASAVPFTNGAAVGLVFGPAGNRGADGAGAGDFIGPASSVENNIIIFGDTTGKLGEDSGVGISTSGANVGRLDGANTYSGAQSYAATVDLQQQLKLSGDITPTQLSANTDDWAPTGLSTCSVIRVSTDASRNLTGLTGGADGRIIILHNVGSFDLVLKDNVTSTTANRFSFGADYYLHAGQTIAMIYDATATRWKALSYVGVGAQFITATSTQALAVGIAGATNPAFQVDTYSGGAIVSGIKITGTGTGVAPQLSVISSDTNLSLAIDAKGSGAITFGATSTGAIQFSRSAVPTSSDGAALGTTALMW
jgi:hypothetical protein